MSSHDQAASADEIFRETSDASGERVVLLKRVWKEKIVIDHPEMATLVDEVVRAISAPDHVEDDPMVPSRRRCYLRGAGPSEWLLVVISYEQAPARLISAFANRKDPPTWSA